MSGTNGDGRGVTRNIGPLAVDLPRSAGYFGGVGLAVAAGLVDPALGFFIAAVPFLKMLSRPEAPRLAQSIGQFFDGMAQPVGGDAEGTIALRRPNDLPRPVQRATKTRSSRARGGRK